VASLKALPTLGLTKLDQLLRPDIPKARQLPAGYDVRTRLYIRGSGWSSARKQVIDRDLPPILARVDVIRAEFAADKVRYGVINAAAKAQPKLDWYMSRDKLPKSAVSRLRSGRLTDSYLSQSSLWDVDHKIPLARHWYASGHKSGDQARWSHATDPSNLSMITMESNRGAGSSHGGERYNYDEKHLAASFTSVYAEGGVKGAMKIDGKDLREVP
jgi:hypothetical protein